MRKVFVAMMALMLTMGMVSCKDNKAAADAAQAVEDAVEQVKGFEVLSLSELVDKATAEGANWSVDQWKDAMRSAMLNLKPIMEEVLNLQKSMDEDPAKAIEALAAMQQKQKDFESMETLMDSLEVIAKTTENGKKVIDDEEWGKQLLKEIGLPEDL